MTKNKRNKIKERTAWKKCQINKILQKKIKLRAKEQNKGKMEKWKTKALFERK